MIEAGAVVVVSDRDSETETLVISCFLLDVLLSEGISESYHYPTFEQVFLRTRYVLSVHRFYFLRLCPVLSGFFLPFSNS